MTLEELMTRCEEVRPLQYPTGKAIDIKFSYNPDSQLLYMMGQVRSYSNSRVLYKVTLVFKHIKAQDKKSAKYPLQYAYKDGKTYYIEKPTVNHHIMTRCACPDFRHMWMWPNRPPKALYGKAIPYTRVPGSTRPPKNPDDIPGACKHIFEFLRKLIELNVIVPTPKVQAYLARKKRETN